ncbi:MAG: hypothetical protein KGL92_11400 [Gammaproteobacteria bacterium]|nr:hypothetical protein [Gammaproteobacteria bacterium]MDE2349096.1 hypothetical protein [Gammaproteobacteria bacterium]
MNITNPTSSAIESDPLGLEQRLLALQQGLERLQRERHTGTRSGLASTAIRWGTSLACVLAVAGISGHRGAAAGTGASPGGVQRVRAPFVVVDALGRVIFQVTDKSGAKGESRAVQVINASGNIAATITVDAYGSTFALGERGGRGSAPTSGIAMSMSAAGTGANATLKLLQAQQPGITLAATSGSSRIAVGGSESGPTLSLNTSTRDGATVKLSNQRQAGVSIAAASGGGSIKLARFGSPNSYVTAAANNDGLGLKVRSDGHSLAWIGAGVDSADGQVLIFGHDHAVAGLQTYSGGKGQMTVWNAAGQPVAFLAESDKNSGGNVTVANGSGTGVFSAGATADGGDACADHKGHLHCLGVSIP